MAKRKSGAGGIKKARKPSDADLALARRNGYRTGKPSKSGVKATTASVNSYIERYNKWADTVRSRAKAQKAKDSDKAKGTAGRKAIAGL